MIAILRGSPAPAVFSVLVALACATPAPAVDPEGWRLWPSPWNGAERLDLEQTVHGGGSNVFVTPEHGAGQVFVPGRSPLVRMDFLIDTRRDKRPGRVRLWRWRGSHARTTKALPLWDDVVEMTERYGRSLGLYSFFPGVEVDPGASYFVEFSAPGRGPYRLGHSRDGVDHYEAGRVHFRGGFPKKAASWDLWFRTYTAPEGEGSRPPFAHSSPRARWTLPLSDEGEVSKSDYLDVIEALADDVRPGLLSKCRTVLSGNAFLEAFLYGLSCRAGSCDEQHARNAARIFHKAHAWRFCTPMPSGVEACNPACDPDRVIGFSYLEHPTVAYRWIRDSPSLGPADHARIRELLVEAARIHAPEAEVGTHSRAVQGAFGLRLAADLFPEEADAKDWRRKAERVWQEIRRRNESREDSAEYVGIRWFPAVLEYAAFTGRDDELWKDPGFRDVVDRYFALVAPLGVLPNFGHSAGWAREVSGLIWLFEKAAARYEDGRYRWMAHRLWRYQQTRARTGGKPYATLGQTLPYLALAYLDTDESIPPRPLEVAGSLVTERTRTRLLPRDEQGPEPGRYFAYPGGRVSDKLVLRSGPRPEDMHAVVNLLGEYSHSTKELGALVSLIDAGSVLMMGTPFPYFRYDDRWEYESVPFLRRYQGGSYEEPGRHAAVARFDEHQNVTAAWLEWRDPLGWGVRQERRFYFVKNRFLLIRDHFRFPDAMRASAGPLFHFGDLRPERGEDWFVGYAREPVGSREKYRNPERYLLVHFVSRANRESHASFVPSHLPPGCPRETTRDRLSRRCHHGPPYVAYQRWNEHASAGESVWFDTLLLPFGPELAPEQAARRVDVLHADAESVALEVKIGDETWTLFASPSGRRLRGGGFDFEGRYAIVRSKPDAPPYAALGEATRLERGAFSFRSETPRSEERSAFDHSARPGAER